MWGTVKRSIRKLRHYKMKTVLLFLFFTAVFLMFFFVILSFGAVKQEIQNAENLIGKSICIYKKWKSPENKLEETTERITSLEIQGITRNELIDDYNLLLAGSKKYRDEEYPMLGVTNSEKTLFFSALGFQMLQGEGISSSNVNKKVVLIPRELAQGQGLQVGDVMTISSGESDKIACGDRSIEVKVVGIYDSQTVTGTGSGQESQILFLPYPVLEEAYFAIGGVSMVQLYFQDMKSLKEYMEDFQSNYDTTGKGEHYYAYYWNEDGYKKVAEPLNHILNLCKALMVVMGAGITGIIWNIGAVGLKKNKFEAVILLSCGEKLRNILFQNILETFLPMLCSVLIAFTLASAASDSLVGWTNTIYMQNQEEINRLMESKNIRENLLREDSVTKMLFRPNTSDIKTQPIRKETMNFGWYTGILAVLIMLAFFILYMQSWLYLRQKSIRGIMQKE